jgi:hypothetical protein
MPISPFLDRNIEFDTEAKRVMGVAFEMTRVSLGLTDDLANGNHRQANYRTCEGRRAQSRSFV